MTWDDADRTALRPARGRVDAGARSRNAGLTARLASATVVALAVANCSQQTSTSTWDAKYGVHASRRVIRDGEPVPKGGGRDLVGRPYVIAGRTYVPRENPDYVGVGLASWYGPNFHGRLTANGEIFDRHAIAAAHATMPIPSYARVTNLENGRSIIVRVNDRGPYHDNRIVDVSQATAEALDFRHKGTARVRAECVRRASPQRSDDRILLSSLRTDGQPATLSGAAPTTVAWTGPRPGVPRPALALRSYDPSPTAEVAALPRDATTGEEAGPGSAAVPLPPQRPSALATAPGAAQPTALAGGTPALRPASRPLVAGLPGAPPGRAPASLKQAGTTEPAATKDAAGLNRHR